MRLRTSTNQQAALPLCTVSKLKPIRACKNVETNISWKIEDVITVQKLSGDHEQKGDVIAAIDLFGFTMMIKIISLNLIY